MGRAPWPRGGGGSGKRAGGGRAGPRGISPGPPHGIPIAVKALFDQAGLPTTAGAAIRRSHRAAEHATAVRRLLDAGAVGIGKTNLPEFAFGVTSINPPFGAV